MMLSGATFQELCLSGRSILPLWNMLLGRQCQRQGYLVRTLAKWLGVLHHEASASVRNRVQNAHGNPRTGKPQPFYPYAYGILYSIQEYSIHLFHTPYRSQVFHKYGIRGKVGPRRFSWTIPGYGAHQRTSSSQHPTFAMPPRRQIEAFREDIGIRRNELHSNNQIYAFLNESLVDNGGCTISFRTFCCD